jgi:hypothetical protein
MWLVMSIDDYERLGVTLSIITVILFISAIIVFIHYGAGLPFYLIIVVAFIVGFLNAWIISRIGIIEHHQVVIQPAITKAKTTKRSKKAAT